MKCALCTAEIEEAKTFPPRVVNGKEYPPDAAAIDAHGAALEKWDQVTVSTTRGGAQLLLLVCYTCPDHRLEPGGVALSKEEK